MLVLYLLAHVMMTDMRIGRYLYAVGGNREAARLSGVPVRRVTLLAYVASGLLAGLGGVIMASQLKSGSATYGNMYELYVIAAVVVGGTSINGGEGRCCGTLHRRLDHRRHSERHEPARRRELYAKDRAGPGDPWCRVAGQTAETRLTPVLPIPAARHRLTEARTIRGTQMKGMKADSHR